MQVRAGSRALYRPLAAAVGSDARKAEVGSDLRFDLEQIYCLTVFTEEGHPVAIAAPSVSFANPISLFLAHMETKEESCRCVFDKLHYISYEFENWYDSMTDGAVIALDFVLSAKAELVSIWIFWGI